MSLKSENGYPYEAGRGIDAYFRKKRLRAEEDVRSAGLSMHLNMALMEYGILRVAGHYLSGTFEPINLQYTYELMFRMPNPAMMINLTDPLFAYTVLSLGACATATNAFILWRAKRRLNSAEEGFNQFNAQRLTGARLYNR